MTLITALNDPALIRAFAHPLRAQIFGTLGERRASPKELADEYGVPLANIAYHVRVLLDLKLIRLVKKTPRRGAIEHHYEAVRRMEVSDSAWAATPGLVKDKMVAAYIEEIGRSVASGAMTGGFSRDNAHMTRTRLVLDEEAWAELSELMMGVLRRADELTEDTKKRQREADHENEQRASLVMMLFEEVPAVPAPADAARSKPGRPARKTAASGRTRSRASR
jgi:DNA-binding transcriptional ArsR family regulator